MAPKYKFISNSRKVWGVQKYVTLYRVQVHYCKALQKADIFVVSCFAKYETRQIQKLSKQLKLIRSFEVSVPKQFIFIMA